MGPDKRIRYALVSATILVTGTLATMAYVSIARMGDILTGTMLAAIATLDLVLGVRSIVKLVSIQRAHARVVEWLERQATQ